MREQEAWPLCKNHALEIVAQVKEGILPARMGFVAGALTLVFGVAKG